jgi:thioredoxin 1
MLQAPTQVVTVTDDTFADLVLAERRPVVVDFWAEWCRPCLAISRSLAELAGEFAGRVVVAKLDVDDNPLRTREYQVLAMPTLLFVRDGRVVDSVVGARPKAYLRQRLTDLLA